MSTKKHNHSILVFLLIWSSCMTVESHIPHAGSYYYGIVEQHEVPKVVSKDDDVTKSPPFQPLSSSSSGSLILPSSSSSSSYQSLPSSSSSSLTSSSTLSTSGQQESNGQQQESTGSHSSYIFPSSSPSLSSLSRFPSSSQPSSSLPQSSQPSSQNTPSIFPGSRISRHHQYPKIPSCSQLREMWMKSYRDRWSSYGSLSQGGGVKGGGVKEGGVNGGKFGMIITNEIQRIPPLGVISNPYYYNLLTSREGPVFGNFKYTKDEVSDSKDGNTEKVPPEESSSPVESEAEKGEEVFGIEKMVPGTFHDRPASESELGPIFGHVIVGTDGSQSLAGTFGEFESSPSGSGGRKEISDDRTSKDRNSDGEINGRRRGSKSDTSRRKSSSRQSSSSSSSRSDTFGSSPQTGSRGSMTANDFFNAIWHEKPVVVGPGNVGV